MTGKKQTYCFGPPSIFAAGNSSFQHSTLPNNCISAYLRSYLQYKHTIFCNVLYIPETLSWYRCEAKQEEADSVSKLQLCAEMGWKKQVADLSTVSGCLNKRDGNVLLKLMHWGVDQYLFELQK